MSEATLSRVSTRRKRPRRDRIYTVLATLVTLLYILRDGVRALEGDLLQLLPLAIWLWVYTRQWRLLRTAMRSETELPVPRWSWVWLAAASAILVSLLVVP